jgi:hypothetical protein
MIRRLRPGRALTAALLAGITTTAGLLSAGNPASAATSTMMTVTAVSPKIIASGTASQVITLTGTGFDESSIASVAIDKCGTAPTYIVISTTTLALKTAGTDCSAGSATITVTDSDGNTVVTTGTGNQVLSFAAPPTIATISSSVRPVVNDNTATLAYADQAATSPVDGGTVVRVLAGSTPFVNSTALPLKASLGGTAMTDVKMATDGSYFTAKAPKHASGAVGLNITSAGVSKTFSSTDTGYSYAGTVISLSPNYGPSNGGATISITGTGFVASGSGASTVTFGTGSGAPTGTVDSAKSTATKLVVATPALPAGQTEGPVTVVVNTGSVNSVVNQNSTYTYTAR